MSPMKRAFAVIAACALAIHLIGAQAAYAADALAKQIVEQSGVPGGLIVHVGCGDNPELTAALRLNESFIVQGLETDTEKISKARKAIQDAGIYGPVSVIEWDGKTLSYVDNLVRLLVISEAGKLSRSEIERVLCPGGVAYSLHPSTLIPHPFRKPWPKELDEWPQHFRAADNNAVSSDRVVGPPRRSQWIAEPYWQRSHLALPSINSLVSAGGRLFTVEDMAPAEHPALPGEFHLVCRDAFNGIMLWKVRFPDWHPITIYMKYTPVQIQRRLAAFHDRVYATPGWDAPITVFDAVTGKVVQRYEGSEQTREFIVEDDAIYTVIGDPAAGNADLGIMEDVSIMPKAFPSSAYGPILKKIEHPVCKLAAFDRATGKILWEKSGDDTLGFQDSGLAAKNGRLVYCTDQTLICLDRVTGKPIWKTPIEKPTWSVNKAHDKKYSGGSPLGASVSLVMAEDAVYLAAEKTLNAYSLVDGSKRWSAKTHINHHKAADVFVVGDLVWTSTNTAYRALNGQPAKYLMQKMTGPMLHDRCFRNRITERWYINTVTGGLDFLGLDGSGEFPHPWVRSTCGIGALPANGLLYAGPPACACNNAVQLHSLNALSTEPDLKKTGQPVAVQPQEVLKKGPAFDAVTSSEVPRESAEDWTTYRGQAGRNGVTTTAVPAELRPSWTTKMASRPSAPVIAEGRLYVAETDSHAVCALSAEDGRLLWRFTAGGRVDSPPTYYRGLLLFGCRDGLVYALRASDGALAWRFRALPERLICAYEQLESAWPVGGSILVKNDLAYFVAGRNSFLDGGLFVYALEPKTGAVVHRQRLAGPYGSDGFPLIVEPEITGGFGLLGNIGDLLSADENHIYLRHQAFLPDLTPVSFEKMDKPHLIPSHGFTIRVPHHRSFWTMDTMIRFDGPTGQGDVHGDILVYDGPRYYEVRGYSPARGRPFDPREKGYQLFAGDLDFKATPLPQREPGKFTWLNRSPFRGTQRWKKDIPLTGRAMTLAGNTLFVAGTLLEFPDDDLAKTYAGRGVGVLWSVASADGRKLAEYKLDAPPVWDGMAAANGCLFLSLEDGQVLCLGKKGNKQ